MNFAEAGFLGLLQGLGEFLPISSSAHLALAPWLFRFPDPGLTFDVALHVGTLAAISAVLTPLSAVRVLRWLHSCWNCGLIPRSAIRRLPFRRAATSIGFLHHRNDQCRGYRERDGYGQFDSGWTLHHYGGCRRRGHSGVLLVDQHHARQQRPFHRGKHVGREDVLDQRLQLDL